MRVGVVYPQTELGGDAGAVRAYDRRVEELGYTHVPAYDHVVGADPEVYTDWNGPYDINTTFHEPMVMFGYLAAITTSLELVTGVIILPQRQAVPVAKQATEVDLLSGGRLRLGVGVGWNPVEYEALGEDFHSRGKRCEEQVELMRTLWTQQSVTYHGTFHRVTGAGWHRCRSNGRSPCGSARNRHRPTDAPDASVTAGSRVTRSSRAPSSTRPVGIVLDAAAEAGGDPASLGMDGRVNWRRDPEEMARGLQSWADAGATHVSIKTMGAGLKSVDDHLDALASAAEVVKALASQAV